MPGTRTMAYIFAAASLATYLAAYLFGAAFLLGPAATRVCGGLLLLGGPCCLAAALALALRAERLAGALLWLGGAAASIGLSVGNGPHAARYFVGMGALVFPQVLAACLFLFHARGLAKSPSGSRPARGR